MDLHGTKSEVSAIESGVPQGSVLGPLLYIIYVNDMDVEGVTMYADDTSLLVSANNSEHLVSSANRTLSSLCNYFSNNGLHLNGGKTVMVDFTLSSNSITSSYLVWAGERSIVQTEVCSFLGLHLDRALTWSNHVDVLCGKLASRCYGLRMLSCSVDLSVMRRFYFAHIHSIISYGLIAWGASSDCSHRVLVLQKRAIRTMAGVGRLTSCRQLFKAFKVLTTPSIYIYQLALYAHRHLVDGNLLGRHHNYATRGGVLEYPRHRTSAYESGPYYRALKTFNSLPGSLKGLSEKEFKTALHAFLVARTYYSFTEFLTDAV